MKGSWNSAQGVPIPVADLGEGPPTSLILDKKKESQKEEKPAGLATKPSPPPLRNFSQWSKYGE